MVWVNLITIAATGVIIHLIMSYISTYVNTDVSKNSKGQYVLRANKFYKNAGLIVLCLAIFIIFMMLYTEGKDKITLAIVFGGLMLSLPIYCLVYYYNHRVIFDDKRIQKTGFTGKTTETTWAEIISISFSPFSSSLKIHLERRRVIKISNQLVGFISFVEMMEKKTKWTAKGLKLPTNEQNLY
ncbi:MAG: hypothetical protein R3E32_29675 [Chitinophagales bacterium]